MKTRRFFFIRLAVLPLLAFTTLTLARVDSPLHKDGPATTLVEVVR